MRKLISTIFIWVAFFLAGWQVTKFIIFWTVGNAPVWQTSNALFVQLVLNVISASMVLWGSVRTWRGDGSKTILWPICALTLSGVSVLIAVYAEVWAGEIDWLSIAGLVLSIAYLVAVARFRTIQSA